MPRMLIVLVMPTSYPPAHDGCLANVNPERVGTGLLPGRSRPTEFARHNIEQHVALLRCRCLPYVASRCSCVRLDPVVLRSPPMTAATSRGRRYSWMAGWLRSRAGWPEPMQSSGGMQWHRQRAAIGLKESPGCRSDQRVARTSWTNCTTMDPSPTAAATRLADPERTSPAANTPGRLVSSKNGGRRLRQ